MHRQTKGKAHTEIRGSPSLCSPDIRWGFTKMHITILKFPWTQLHRVPALVPGEASFPRPTNLSEINPDKEACVAVEKRNPKCLQLICHIRMGSF